MFQSLLNLKSPASAPRRWPLPPDNTLLFLHTGKYPSEDIGTPSVNCKYLPYSRIHSQTHQTIAHHKMFSPIFRTIPVVPSRILVLEDMYKFRLPERVSPLPAPHFRLPVLPSRRHPSRLPHARSRSAYRLFPQPALRFDQKTDRSQEPALPRHSLL